MNNHIDDKVTYKTALASETPAILTLLKKSLLPLDGVPGDLSLIILAMYQGQIIGCASLETYGEHALLRSVAVEPDCQMRGIGTGLIKDIIRKARSMGTTELYLLTETARIFFSHMGFSVCDRQSVPRLVRNSIEFTTACPDSAIAMHLSLEQP